MLRIAILGATGPLGQHLVSEALGQGLEVHALVRNASKLTRANYDLTVFQGDAETGVGLAETLQGCRYVISALGSPRPIMATCISQVLRAMPPRGLERFVFISWLGAGDSAHQARAVPELRSRMTGLLRRRMFEDLGHAEGVVRVSRLPYTIVRPTRLTEEAPRSRLVAVGSRETPPGPVSRAELAKFVFQILGDFAWLRREATVGSRAEPHVRSASAASTLA